MSAEKKKKSEKVPYQHVYKQTSDGWLILIIHVYNDLFQVIVMELQ
jgi:hypothetical protein